MNIMKAWPLPNQVGNAEQRNNFFFTGKALEDYWVWLTRVDHAFSQNHRMFVRLHRDFWEEDKNRWFNDNITGIILNRNNKGLAVDDVYIFSPSFLANFRYGLTYQDFPERRVSQGFDLASLGFSQSFLNLVPDKARAVFPRVQLTPYTTLSSWESGDGVTASTTHSFVANFTKLKGSHNMRFGPEFRVYQENNNRYPDDDLAGSQLQYHQRHQRSAGYGGSAPVGWAGGLVPVRRHGYVQYLSRIDSYAEQDKYLALYFHDDWKVTSKFTVNIGLRYEYESPITERFNRAVLNFDGTTPNPINDAARANYASQTNRPAEVPVSAFQRYGRFDLRQHRRQRTAVLER
jgi:hypothetical protein